MSEIPIEINQRLAGVLCVGRALRSQELRGYGVDGYVWQTTQDSILKVYPKRVALSARTRRL